MGIFIGIPVLTVGLIMPGARAYFTRSLVAFAVVAATALAVGLGGLAWARYDIAPEGLEQADSGKAAFAWVGVMHLFSYLGGFLGILTASAYLVAARVRWARPSTSILIGLEQEHPVTGGVKLVVNGETYCYGQF